MADTSSEPHEDLRTELLSYINKFADVDPEATVYHEYGDFRPTRELTDEEYDELAQVREDHDCQTQQCYYNAQRLILVSGEWTYCEGYMLEDGLVPIKHAWVERDGAVWEVTLPWHLVESDADRVYYGVAYEDALVAEALADAGAAYPLAGTQHNSLCPDGSTRR